MGRLVKELVTKSRYKEQRNGDCKQQMERRLEIKICKKERKNEILNSNDSNHKSRSKNRQKL
jgi:hypothetical protein